MDEIEKAIEKDDDIYFVNRLEDDVEFINSVSVDKINFKDLRIKIKLDKNSCALDKLDNDNSLPFYDIFGFSEEFKYLFRGFRDGTELSKKEISDVLCDKLTCDAILFTSIIFSFRLNISDIIV